MIITTGEHDPVQSVARAKMIAEETGTDYVRRAGRSLEELKVRYGQRDILVILENAIRLRGETGQIMEFHPSMSFVRAKRVYRGESDPMLRVAKVQPGDTIVDCTAGLGADSIMFAVGAGTTGRVISMESSFPLYMLLKAGLQSYQVSVEAFNEALRRIEVRHTDHLTGLRTLADQSVDIVYFDPMFRDPTLESASLSPLRSYANGAALSLEAISEARRVARKAVVLKEKRDSGEFERLGFKLPDRKRTIITYGVMQLDC